MESHGWGRRLRVPAGRSHKIVTLKSTGIAIILARH